MGEILDGEKVAKSIKDRVKLEVEEIKEERGNPGLAAVLVGTDSASRRYINNKEKACEYVGIASSILRESDTITQDRLLKIVNELNDDPKVNGILVQLPLPEHIDENVIMSKIDPLKDVDGFHSYNLGELMKGERGLISCTPYGVEKILDFYNIPIEGKHAVVVGRSVEVGKPMATIMTNRNATVTLCHSKTKDLEDYTSQADILIVAVGKPKYITTSITKNKVPKKMVKPGAVVIDIGIHDTPNGLVGDVDFNAVKDVASYITPVPGGVGPMTIAMLMSNTAQAAKMQKLYKT